jgi:hypothetical protein
MKATRTIHTGAHFGKERRVGMTGILVTITGAEALQALSLSFGLDLKMRRTRLKDETHPTESS